MDCQIVIAPELGVNAQDFVAAWNDAPECRNLAEAQLSAEPTRGFPLDPDLVQQGLVFLAGGAATIVLDALKNAVKEKLTEYFKKNLSKKPSIKVKSIRQPGGAYLLVVTEEDE